MIEARNGARVLVVNVMGRLFMDPLDDPFAAVERELSACPLGEVADKNALLRRIEQTIAAHDILRLKGFADVKGSPARLLVQAVGPRLNSYFDRPWRAGEARGTQLVVIGEKHMDREAIAAMLRG